MTKLEMALTNLLSDLRMLAGEEVGPSDVSWQDIAATAAVNATVLTRYLERARTGDVESATLISVSIGHALDTHHDATNRIA